MAKGGPKKRKEEGTVNELGAVSLNESKCTFLFAVLNGAAVIRSWC